MKTATRRDEERGRGVWCRPLILLPSRFPSSCNPSTSYISRFIRKPNTSLSNRGGGGGPPPPLPLSHRKPALSSNFMMAAWKSAPFPYDLKVGIAYDVSLENNTCAEGTGPVRNRVAR